MTANPQRQQRTHSQAEATGAPSERFEVMVALTPEVLDVARQRLQARYEAALCEAHRTGAGAISDLFADLQALANTRPKL